MEHTKSRLSLLPFLVPVIAMPALILVASVLALSDPKPAPPEPEVATDEAAAAPDAPGARVYFPLIEPITVALPNGLERVKIGIGVALDKQRSGALLMAMADQSDVIQAELVQAVLTTAEDMPDQSSAEDLRALLPEVLRSGMNAKLATMGLEPAVLEVMVTEWAIAR